jgi:hypothetical protein
MIARGLATRASLARTAAIQERRLTQRNGAVAAAALALLVVGGVALTMQRQGEGDLGRRSPGTTVQEALLEELQPVQLTNCELARYGEPHDGGYLMCANLLGDVEAGYSYGISGYDQWGCDISTSLGVRVHQYDCFDTRQTSCPTGDLAFHAECVAGATFVDADGRPFDTLERQFARNGDSIRQLVVKMDVEGAEWDSLAALPEPLFDRIDQLAMELHGVHEERFLAVVRRLKQHFHLVNVHYNNHACDPSAAPLPAWAVEVLFVSKRLGTLDPSGRRPEPSPLNTPVNPALPDCQPGDPHPAT